MYRRVLFSMALWLTLCAVALCAQAPQTSPTPGKGASTPPPSAQPADPRLRLAQAQGRAETAAVDWVLANSGPLHGDIHAGEFRVAFTITPAEGWWDKAGGGKLAWHDAPAYNVHLRIFVLDLADGRLVPDLHLRATLIDANGNEQAAPVAFGWYPLIDAYGGNVPLAADSTYTLRVAIDRDAKDTKDDPDASHPSTSQERPTRTAVADFPPVPIAQNDVMQFDVATASISTADEAELLKPYNDALSAAITALWQQSAAGAEEPSDDYFVAYALGDPALAKLRVKNLFEFSGKDNVRLEVLVRDSRTGRLIPGLNPQASLLAADGAVYNPGGLPFDLNSWLDHYGRSLRIPRKGLYTLTVTFDAPGFRRWGRQSGRFASSADVEFDNLSLKPESSKSEASKPEGR
jgi:hypothetical protein